MIAELAPVAIFLFILFLLLGTGVWVGLALLGVAWFGMEVFTNRPVGDAMMTILWRSSSSWSLTALPLFIWMGEILFRTRLSVGHVQGALALDGQAARWPAAYQCRRLHRVCRCLRFLGRDLDHRRQNVHPGTPAPQLSGENGDRHPGGSRDPRPDDPAVADPDRLWRHHQRIDHQAFRRRNCARLGAGRAVHELCGDHVEIVERLSSGSRAGDEVQGEVWPIRASCYP